MESDHEIREAILGLLKKCKAYQARALALNTALKVLLELPPAKRADLTRSDVEAHIHQAQSQATQIVNELAAGLERALSGDKDFLMFLELYLQHPKHEQ